MTRSRVDWVWALPPTEALRHFADELVEGRLPPGHEVVKSNRPRTVWRVPQVAGGLLVKHYRVQTKDAWRALVSPGRAEREYRAMELLRLRGVPTVQPLGYADRRERGWLKEAWFLGRLVPDATTLADALAALPPGSEACWALAEQAAEVVARLHGHRVWHRDLHAGNLLLDAEGRLLVIDLHSMWRVPPLRRHRMGNLAHLLHSMRASLDLDAFPRFVAAYARHRGEPVDQLVREVRVALAAFEADHVRGRSARCMRNSSEFVGERHVLGRVHRLRVYPPEALEADCTAHDEIVRAGGDDLLGDAPRCKVSRVNREPGRVLKEYLDRGLVAAWRARLGLGKARSAWKAARRCDVVGIPTPRALALLERPDGSARLVTDEVEGGCSLEEYLEGARPPGLEVDRKELSRMVGLSRFGLRHDDMSTKNLMLAPGEPEATGDQRTEPPRHWPRVLLIDLDNTVRTRPHDPAALVRMLGQLGDLPPWVTRADRRRFARGFARAAGRGLPSAVVARADALTRIRQARRAAREAAAAARPSA